VVFGPGKSPETLVEICSALVERGSDVLATRVDQAQAAAVAARLPAARYNSLARTLRIGPADGDGQPKAQRGKVAVLTAGTGDLPVAEEAVETLDWMGVATVRLSDVGVAGPQRLREQLHLLDDVDAVVVVAGMEGALPSVVGGYVACPVVGVPTSVGYGANFGGLSALLSMLNSCAANVTVVNIDAGFKGAYVAGLIASRRAEAAVRSAE
jgi:NCAIR mutase (PurE)-related protein